MNPAFTRWLEEGKAIFLGCTLLIQAIQIIIVILEKLT